jgi:hypothetical protein
MPSDLVFSTTSSEFYASKEHFKMDSYYHYRDVFDLVRQNISGSLKLQKRIYDKRTNFTKYAEGDTVLLYKPIPSSVKDYRKLKNTFTGPHVIVKCISEHNYIIKHCQTNKEELVHHDAMRLLRKKQPLMVQTSNDSNQNTEIQTTDESIQLLPEIQDIVDSSDDESGEENNEHHDNENHDEAADKIIETDILPENPPLNKNTFVEDTADQPGEDMDTLLEKMAEEDSEGEESSPNKDPLGQPTSESDEDNDDKSEKESSTDEESLENQETVDSQERRSQRKKHPPARFGEEYHKYYGKD